MENPRTLSYGKLLDIYLEDRKLIGKNTNKEQLQDLELMSKREMTTAGRFYIKIQSYDYAITWLQRTGYYPQALYVLGVLYMKHPHIAPDSNEKARMYFMKSQTSPAYHNLGNMYNNGVGVPRDKQEALKWYVRGGLQGLNRSKYEAGLIYFEDAHRSRQSAKLAYYWFKSAVGNKNRRKAKNSGSARKLEELIDMLDYDIEALARNYNPYRDRREVHTVQDNHEDDIDNNYDEEGSGDEMNTQPESSVMAASESSSSNNNNNSMAPPQSSYISASNSPSPFMAAANNMARPESSFMALSRDAVQAQSPFTPLSNNAFQPESSSMAAANNMARPESSSMALSRDAVQAQSPFTPPSNNAFQPESSSMAASNNPSPFMTAANDTQLPPPSSNTSRPEYSIMTRSKSNNNNNMTQPVQSARLRQLEDINSVYKRTIARLEHKISESRRLENDHINSLKRKNKDLRKRIKDMENLFYWIAENDANSH